MEREKLRQIYRKTDGYCHICHGKLSLANYGVLRAKGAWHIEHSKARANGGSDHLNNLFPACISCNIDKGTKHTKTARARHGNTRAPLSRAKKKAITTENTIGGGVIGAVVGSFFGPVGTLVGAGIGAAIGSDSGPKK